MRRYNAYASALEVLMHADEQDLSNEFIMSGIVDKFSLQFELGWKLLKDLLRYEGVASVAFGSPRQILKESYRYFDFLDEETWLAMLCDRNTIAHVYDGMVLQKLVERVIAKYIPAFCSLLQAVRERYAGELDQIA